MLKSDIKYLNIEIPKQNYQKILVGIKKDGEKTELESNDLIFFSVKENYNDTEYKIQKTLGNGIEYNQDTKNYEIILESQDTANLQMNKVYGYDITIYYDGDKPSQKVLGTLKITTKYTLNEVVNNG